MNWKWGTASGVMVLITLVAIVYAFVQTVAAQNAERRAMDEKELAVKARTDAERQRIIAQEHAELYRKALKEAEECKKNKK